MNNCCPSSDTPNSTDSKGSSEPKGHAMKKRRPSIMLWGSLLVVVAAYSMHLFASEHIQGISQLATFTEASFDLMNEMWWGMLLGIIFVGLLESIPRELIMSLLGKGGTFGGILRATSAGVLLDLCSHGILMVGMKLYQRGASLGQTMAFIIASPWNSISLTLILWALIGFWWMLAFLLLSMIIAIISGLIFDALVKKGVLASNPVKVTLPEGYSIKSDFSKYIKSRDYSANGAFQLLLTGLRGSKMILKWILFGMVLASLVRTFVPPESFETLFGPTLAGLGLTVLVATILEVCSEGSTPIASDILTRAGAPGNSFAFLMTGVSTDYTEIMAIKETTKSWKTAFFLPLVTFPQILAIAIILNGVGV